MRYATLKKNDVANGPRVCVSLFTQGCPHHCYNCFNPETWSYDGGIEIGIENLGDMICSAIEENGVRRDFNILGGEPLCEENIGGIIQIISKVRAKYPDIKIYIWTGYIYENLACAEWWPAVADLADFLIDGPYIDEQRDITLRMRGSRNQRIIDLKTGKDITKIFDSIV